MAKIEGLKFDENGLLAAVIQDAVTEEVLMVAFMNEEAIAKTVETGSVHFWSRSRKKLWLKGESSGHTQTVREIRIDCDGDALLIKVEQKGGACHTGYRSCFYRKMLPAGQGFETCGEKVFDPDRVYH